MHCTRLENRNSNQGSVRDEGSAIVGFALVMPLLVLVLIVSIQISMVLAQRSVLLSAAHTGARTAATLGATHHEGKIAALQVLSSQNFQCGNLTLETSKTVVNGSAFVVVIANCQTRIDWINREVSLHAVARAIDENSL